MFAIALLKSKFDSEAQPPNVTETSEIANWRSILSKADAPRDRYCEAVAALNVKVICELAPLLRARPSYESFQQAAVALALSIQDELFRSFALKQVKGLFRRAAAHPWREPTPDRSKTPLIASGRPKWLGQGLREPVEPGEHNSRTPLF